MLAWVSITPFVGAILIGWIFSVCVHEFAHAIVAYWGGDRSVKERGYLTFNPLLYIHPVTSILMPCIFLLMGGIPLPGGAVMIQPQLLRGRHWEALVSVAGPAANVLLFVLLAVLLQPGLGLVDGDASQQPTWARLVGALAILQLFAVIINMIPLPPFDGFGIIEPYLPDDARAKFALPHFRWLGIIGVFFVLFRSESAMGLCFNIIDQVMERFGLPEDLTWGSFRLAFG